MAKIYTKNTWTDELLAGAERYDVKDNAGAAIETNVQINLTTPVAVAGTEINASRMNNIETGIDALDTLSAPGSVMRASGANVQTLAANKTLVDADYALQVLTPTAARDVTLPAVASTNHPYYIINASATYVLTVKNAGGTTIGIVAISSSGSFASDATAWHSFGGGGSLTKAAGSDVATGTDDAKYVTAKAIKDSVNVPNVAPGTSGNVMTSTGEAWVSSAAGTSLTKAAGSDVATGTDDAKYVTAKAIKDSVNVPNVAPGAANHTLRSTGSAWESAFDSFKSSEILGMADDTAIAMPIYSNRYFFTINTNATDYFLGVNNYGAIATIATAGSISVVGGNGTLAGTTGTDGRINIRASNQIIYIENRSGSPRNIGYAAFGSDGISW